MIAAIIAGAQAAGGVVHETESLFSGNATDSARDQRVAMVLDAAKRGSVLAARFILGGMSGDASIKAPASADRARFQNAYNSLMATTGGAALIAVAHSYGATEVGGGVLTRDDGAIWNPNDDPHNVPYSGPIGDAVAADLAKNNPDGGYSYGAPSTTSPISQPNTPVNPSGQQPVQLPGMTTVAQGNKPSSLTWVIVIIIVAAIVFAFTRGGRYASA